MFFIRIIMLLILNGQSSCDLSEFLSCPGGLSRGSGRHDLPGRALDVKCMLLLLAHPIEQNVVDEDVVVVLPRQQEACSNGYNWSPPTEPVSIL